MSSSSFSGRAADQSGSAQSFFPVTPNDAVNLPNGVTRAVYVGGAGSLTVQDAAGNTATLISASAQYHPLCVARVLATGTTAVGVVALY